MADAYPWGSKSPAQRVTALDAQLRANEKKREDLEKAHKTKIAEITETHRKAMSDLSDSDRQVRADLKVAHAVIDRERRERVSQAAAKAFERIVSNPNADIDSLMEKIASGDFESLVARAIAEQAPRKGKAKTEAPARSAGDDGDASGAAVGAEAA